MRGQPWDKYPSLKPARILNLPAEAVNSEPCRLNPEPYTSRTSMEQEPSRGLSKIWGLCTAQSAQTLPKAGFTFQLGLAGPFIAAVLSRSGCLRYGFLATK